MAQVYRQGEAEMRAAIGAALAVGVTADDLKSGFFVLDREKGIVAAEGLIDRFLLAVGELIFLSLSSGDGLALREFGRFELGYSPARYGSGAVDEQLRIPAHVRARFSAAGEGWNLTVPENLVT